MDQINNIDLAVTELWWDIEKYTTEGERGKAGETRDFIDKTLKLYTVYLNYPNEIIDGVPVKKLLLEKIKEGQAAIGLLALSRGHK